MKKCSTCGAELDDDAKFCSACGTRFDARPDGDGSPAFQDLNSAVSSVVSEVSMSEEPLDDEDDASATRHIPLSGSGAQAGADGRDAATQAFRAVPGTDRMPSVDIPSPDDGKGGRRGPDMRIALTVLGGIAAIAIIVALAWVGTGHAFPFTDSDQAQGSAEGSAEPAEKEDEAAEAVPQSTAQPVSVSITAINADAFPSVAVDFTLASDAGAVDTSALTAADFSVSERSTSGGDEVPASVERYTTSSGSCRVVYTSHLDADAAPIRVVTLTVQELSGYTGTASLQNELPQPEAEPAQQSTQAQSAQAATPQVTQQEPAATTTSTYILPDSATRVYSASELSGLTDWQLCLARNEIYARHGRGFDTQSIQDYFNSQSWYTRLYSPKEFDSMKSPLNSTEMKNAETIKSVEKARGSQYL